MLLHKFYFIAFFVGFVSLPSIKSQNIEDNYQYISSLDAQMKRKLIANELIFDAQDKYLMVNYGNKPTFIVVFEVGSWQPIMTFRLSDWVEFTGAYVDAETNQLYVKESRYSSDYYRLDIKTGTTEVIACGLTPKGCLVIEPKQSQRWGYSSDNGILAIIDKKNPREVKIYSSK
jgi:hypothetical protein